MSLPVSRRPYMLRAMHAWIGDSGYTPHLVVDAAVEGADLPRQYVKDGKIVFNVSYSATHGLNIAADRVVFSARFNGVTRQVFIPMAAVLGIYARETGEGMAFTEDDMVAGAQVQELPAGKPVALASEDPRRARFKVVK